MYLLLYEKLLTLDGATSEELSICATLFYPFSFREVNIDQTVEERSHCQRGKKLSGNFSAIFHLILHSTTKWRNL